MSSTWENTSHPQAGRVCHRPPRTRRSAHRDQVVQAGAGL